jgi:hypothetical protein
MSNVTTRWRSAGADLTAAVIAFATIAAAIFMAGRWILPGNLSAILVERVAAAAPVDTNGGAAAQLRDRLGEGNGAAIVVAGVVVVDAVLGNAEPTTDLCLGCLQQIAGSSHGVRFGDPVAIGVRFWQGSTVLGIVTDGVAVGEARTEDLRVSLNAGGKVFFGRACSIFVEQSAHAVYRTAVEGETVELLEFRGVDGTLSCAELSNSTTGETVSLEAAFSYWIEDPGL